MKTAFAAPQIPWKDLDTKDFNQYINGCFFKVQGKEKTPYYKKINYPQDLSGLKVDFSFPKSGIYNFKHEVYGFFRHTQRQWKRGICPATALFWSPFEFFSAMPPKSTLQWGEFTVNGKNLDLFFSSKYVKFNEAVASVLEEKCLARAISSRFFVSLGAATTRPLFWQWTRPIGIISEDHKICLMAKELEKDVKEAFPKVKVELLKKTGKEHQSDGIISVDDHPF